MKVLFLYPPKKVLGLNYLGPPVFNLGFLYMAAVLEEDGVEVEILDALAEQLSVDQICAEVKERKPDIVGITATTPTANSVLDLCDFIKETLKDSFIVLGGPHFSFSSEETLRNHPEVDCIVRGEGEYSFRDLVRAKKNNIKLDGIPGLTFKNGTGAIIKNKNRELIKDLDSLPYPAYHLIDIKKYGWLIKDPVSVSVSTSRGCIGGCNFCSSYVFWSKRWRARSPKSIFAEIEFLISNYDVKCISFSDECFTWDIDRVENFFDLILDSGLKIKFYIQARVDHIVQMKKILPKLRKAGVLLVFTGLESADDKVLKSFNKDIRFSQVEEAFRLLHENDIWSWASFIVCSPHETSETYKKNRELVEKTNPDFVGYQTYCIFPGTEKHKLEYAEKIDWDTMDSKSNFYSSKNMNAFESMLFIDWLKMSFPEKYSINLPNKILKKLASE